jgi:ZipA, C-terminal FtsZ-binding domain
MDRMTNPLFLALIAGGVVLVIGVLAYNWWQERRVRRRIEAAFRKPSEVGLDEQRVEPIFRSVPASPGQSVAVETTPEVDDVELPPPVDDAAVESIRPVVPSMRMERGEVAPDTEIECVVLLKPQQAVQTSAIADAMAMRFSKPVRWLGRKGSGLPWHLIDPATSGPWHEIAACFLLANRAGAALRPDIVQFVRLLTGVATEIAAKADMPDVDDAAHRAEELDGFCADLDVQIGLTIIKGELGQIVGTRLRGVAEASGFRLSPAGQFDYIQEETGKTLYSLQNFKQEPFTVEGLRSSSTPGVVFLLDVPRVSDPVRVFDQMRLIAKRMTQTLEGVLVDDNRRPLNDASLAAIREQVQATAEALREAHIDAGGPRAVRLFG